MTWVTDTVGDSGCGRKQLSVTRVVGSAPFGGRGKRRGVVACHVLRVGVQMVIFCVIFSSVFFVKLLGHG